MSIKGAVISMHGCLSGQERPKKKKRKKEQLCFHWSIYRSIHKCVRHHLFDMPDEFGRTCKNRDTSKDISYAY